MGFPELPFGSQQDAEAAVQAFVDAMPPVSSAYRSSGKEGSALQMCFGYMLGLAAASVVMIATLAAGALVVRAGMTVLNEATGGGIVRIGGYLLAAVIGLLVLAGACLLGGWICARINAWAARVAKNRGPISIGLFSAYGGITSATVCRWTMPAFVHISLVEGAAREMMGTVLGTGFVGWIFTGLFVLGTGLVAFGCGVWTTKDAKFCELCNEFMGVDVLPGMSLELAEQLVGQMNAGELDAACKTVETCTGSVVHPSLSRCSHCGQAYLEVYVKIAATFPGERENNKGGYVQAEWLAGSWELEREQSERIGAIAGARSNARDGDGK